MWNSNDIENHSEPAAPPTLSGLYWVWLWWYPHYEPNVYGWYNNQWWIDGESVNPEILRWYGPIHPPEVLR